MATTPLFVEIIVIGVGAFTALALALTATMDAPWLLIRDATSFILAVPFLAFSYVLGVIVDRLADYLHGVFSRQDRRCKPFASLVEYHDANKMIRYHSGPTWQHLEYTRSRMRICRGWSLNCVLLLIGANLWVWLQGNTLGWRLAASGVVTLTLVLILLGCLFSFWSLGRSYHEQVYETHQMLVTLTAAAAGAAGVAGAGEGQTAAIVSVRPSGSLRESAPQPAAR
jgi:hypothetical protein